MGGKESKQVDSQYFEKISFEVNILVCGDYNEQLLQRDLNRIKRIQEEAGLPYIKKGCHNSIKDWVYYFFEKNNEIGNNTKKFIQANIRQNNFKNLILFYKEDNIIEQLIHIIEVTSYCNELGDEIGFPKKFVNEKLTDKDSQLMIKDSFTFNALVCGRPGSGKSLLINRILGKLKCYSGKGTDSLTQRVVKYIHDTLPIVIYDTPGFLEKKDIERVKQLISEKNKNLEEEKNKIHCVFFCANKLTERTFKDEEIDFLKFLLSLGLDIFILVTHAETEERSKDFIESLINSLYQKGGNDQKILNLENCIYPVELLEDNYTKFGLEELFASLYEKYQSQKIGFNITKNNLNRINSIFLGEIKTKENMRKRLTALAKRIRANFKLLAASLGKTEDVKGTTMLSTAVIKIISKIYNHPITTEECLDYIKSKGYTNELIEEDSSTRRFEKLIASLFYENGPAAKEVDCLSNCLIEEYNKEIENDRKFFGYLNSYKNGINEAIESLKKIKD